MIKPKPILYVLFMGISFWISIFYFGFFNTIIWTIIWTAIVGLVLKLYENRY